MEYVERFAIGSCMDARVKPEHDVMDRSEDDVEEGAEHDAVEMTEERQGRFEAFEDDNPNPSKQ